MAPAGGIGAQSCQPQRGATPAGSGHPSPSSHPVGQPGHNTLCRTRRHEPRHPRVVKRKQRPTFERVGRRVVRGTTARGLPQRGPVAGVTSVTCVSAMEIGSRVSGSKEPRHRSTRSGAWPQLRRGDGGGTGGVAVAGVADPEPPVRPPLAQGGQLEGHLPAPLVQPVADGGHVTGVSPIGGHQGKVAGRIRVVTGPLPDLEEDPHPRWEACSSAVGVRCTSRARKGHSGDAPRSLWPGSGAWRGRGRATGTGCAG